MQHPENSQKLRTFKLLQTRLSPLRGPDNVNYPYPAMKTLLLPFLLLSALSISAQTTYFDSLLMRAHLVFEAPKDFIPTEPIENGQMNWEASYKHPTLDFEVRYAIRPMDVLLEEYAGFEREKKEGDILIHPNSLFASLYKVTLLNISGGQMVRHSEFHPEAVREEFNADWGAVAGTTTGAEFGQGYEYCLFVMLHKQNLGEAYIFFMADDSDLILKEMEPIFHNLRFRDE